MKKRSVLILVLCSFVLLSCKQSGWNHTMIDFYFDVPQPAGKTELGDIPKKFRGSYTLGDSLLVVSNKLITSQYTLKSVEHKDILKDSVKEKFSYKKGKLYTGGLIYDVTEKNDSLYISLKTTDTLFMLSNDHKAKQVSNALILNRRDSIYWKMSFLTLKKDSLKWTYPNFKTDYTALQPIVKNMTIDNDTTVIYLKPSRKEFKKITDLKNFGTTLRYKRLK